MSRGYRDHRWAVSWRGNAFAFALVALLVIPSQLLVNRPSMLDRIQRTNATPPLAPLAQSSMKEFPVPTQNAGPIAMVSGPGDNLWFSEFLGGKIGELISANGTFREFQIPERGARPAGLALDGSGRIWFADQGGTGSVWMLDPSTSQFVQYKTKTTNSTPLFVLIDDRGDIWFTELTGNNLGELVYPTYSMLEFSLPTPSSGPAELALQRNASRIWISETYANKVASFDLGSHSFVEYTPTVSLKCPIGIVVDGGGRVWLSEHCGSSIVEFDPTGLTWRKYPTSLPLPSAQYGGVSAPATLALDSGGDLWFVEHFSNRVGRLNSTSGNIDEFVIQTPGGYAYSVLNALDSRGNFWFTDYSANEISFVPANSTAPVSVSTSGSGAIPSIGAGQTLSNRVLVRNRLSVPLRITLNASATFSPGWQPSTREVTLNASTLSLSPGGSSAVGVSITPDSGVASGLYSVGVIASAGNSSSIADILLVVQGSNQGLDFSPVLVAALSIGAILLLLFVVRGRYRGSTPERSVTTLAAALARISGIHPPVLVAAVAVAFFLLLVDSAAIVIAKCPGIPSNPNSGGPDTTTPLVATLGATVAAILIVLIFLRRRKAHWATRKIAGDAAVAILPVLGLAGISFSSASLTGEVQHGVSSSRAFISRAFISRTRPEIRRESQASGPRGPRNY